VLLAQAHARGWLPLPPLAAARGVRGWLRECRPAAAEDPLAAAECLRAALAAAPAHGARARYDKCPRGCACWPLSAWSCSRDAGRLPWPRGAQRAAGSASFCAFQIWRLGLTERIRCPVHHKECGPEGAGAHCLPGLPAGPRGRPGWRADADVEVGTWDGRPAMRRRAPYQPLAGGAGAPSGVAALGASEALGAGRAFAAMLLPADAACAPGPCSCGPAARTRRTMLCQLWHGFAAPGRAAPARMGQGPARRAARPRAGRAGRPCARRRCAAAALSGRAWPPHSAARPPTSSAGARCEPRPRMLQRGAPGRSQVCRAVRWLPGAVLSGLLTCSGRPAAARPPAWRTGGRPCERP